MSTIQGRMMLIFGAFALLLAGVALFTHGVLTEQADDGVLINLAGRQRMLSQKLAKESLQLQAALEQAAGEQAKLARKALRGTAQAFETTLLALRDGGPAPLALDMSKMRVLPPVSTPALRAELDDAIGKWRELQKRLDTLLSADAPRPAEIAYINGANLPLMATLNSVTSQFQAESERKVALIAEVQWTAGALGALITLLGMLYARSIVRQLGGEPVQARRIVRQVADGDTSVEVRVREGDTSSLLAAMAEMVERLRYASGIARQVAAGDMTVRIELREGDRTGLLGAMAEMVTRLSTIVGDVRSAADSLAAASEQLSSSAQLLSDNSSEQAASVEETSASMEQIAATVTQNTDNARATDEIATKSAQHAREGGDAVTHTGHEGHRQAHRHRGRHRLPHEPAGAQCCHQVAAREIGELARGSVSLAERAGGLLHEVLPAIMRTADLVQEIASSSREQSAGLDQVNAAVSQVSQTTQTTASASQELANTARSMSDRAAQLQATMRFFRVGADNENADPRTPVSSTRVEKRRPGANARSASRRGGAAAAG